jgi:hypothetical protein
MLIADIHEDLTVCKQAFLMTQLLKKYLDYLPADIPNTYPVTKLQDRLKIHYGDSIVVQIQRGQWKSNLVFSSDVSIGQAVATAGNLKSKLKTSEIKQEISTVARCHVIRILRRDIKKISISTDEYSTAHEVSLVLSMDRMPLSLTKFICWLLDFKSFKNASEPYNILKIL